MKIPRNRTFKKARIEIIPMIDVMFFLLATMIMASIYLQKINGINVNLSKGHGEKINNLEELITISITHDNLIYVNNDLVGFDSLASYLKKFSNQEISSIIISADSSANHGTVAMAMSIAKQIGAEKFSIITKE